MRILIALTLLAATVLGQTVRECRKDKGECVTEMGQDNYLAVTKLFDDEIDLNDPVAVAECLGECLRDPSSNGCEVIGKTANKGCYSHSQKIKNGNHKDDHICWVFSDCQEKHCFKEDGYCVKPDGEDQGEGVVMLFDGDINTYELQSRCLTMCYADPHATGCEAQWNTEKPGCYRHTKPLSKGNGAKDHVCWVFEKCKSCIKERGKCVSKDGKDVEGETRVLKEEMVTRTARAKCLDKCFEDPKATGCEIRIDKDENKRGCYKHKKPVDRGNREDQSDCWVFSKCVADGTRDPRKDPPKKKEDDKKKKDGKKDGKKEGDDKKKDDGKDKADDKEKKEDKDKKEEKGEPEKKDEKAEEKKDDAKDGAEEKNKEEDAKDKKEEKKEEEVAVKAAKTPLSSHSVADHVTLVVSNVWDLPPWVHWGGALGTAAVVLAWRLHRKRTPPQLAGYDPLGEEDI